MRTFKLGDETMKDGTRRFLDPKPIDTHAIDALRAVYDANRSSPRVFAAAIAERLERDWAKANGLKRARRCCIQKLMGRQCGYSRQRMCECNPPGTDHP